MKVGKLPENILKRSVLKQLTVRRAEVLVGPGVGEDCGYLQLEPDEVCVLSSDPITGTANDIGHLAVQITANDIAASGAEPVGIMLTALLPDEFSEEELKKIVKQVNAACEALNIQVIGGHTEVTKAVNQPILSVTGVGKIKKDRLLCDKTIEAGYQIVMTKWAGLEGTAIIANEKETQLKAHFNNEFVERAKTFGEYLSVIKEAKIGMDYGVVAMHDVTEGGVFGALWELAACAGRGFIVDLAKIPIKQETIEICEYFDINPYKLISSGSLLLVTKDGHRLAEALKSNGIEANLIGHFTDNNDKSIITADTTSSLEPPKTDELYQVL